MEEQKLKELFQDKAFIENLLSKEEASEVVSLLQENDVTITEEEVVKLREAVLRQTEGGELSEEDLADVAGGFVITALGVAITSAIFGGISATAGTGSFIHNVSRGRW